ncbi:dTMP kinase [Sulfolobus acidocaldarius]|uniref:Thymidylate kinase-like protein n=4 Tax=Sulfolobus acidocaldarius TaxID=2285 RepID=Q4J7B5_SULAC|nr:thymidylate kinase [Sulfolobus acidocaldarius]AAY81316.1 thymidylate kinase-like protein [Sulfolobus acidocaldarius DSM 639]AGE71956.1 thymidylate kinase related protein [Sulfolobus acidocaldarius N8]AGE74228.1 thymidylate kinase related protein [Sulfolobus acidocaldarius Ron12/I]ALU29882.1 thymidylate kinase [Sulfolobus acidocaldarius]ALU32622.1 thymidylate kinase [Sulfolobus acidocaldarius]
MEKGRIIAIEGIMSSGKTTHVQSLRDYLEDRGYVVTTIGIQSSKLMADAIASVKRDIVFQRRTLFLAYVTDLADQTENLVKPSLDSGFIVIADGYVLTLEAWALTRRLEREWVEGVLSMLPKASLSISLISPPTEIMRRIIKRKGFLDPLSESVDLNVKEDTFLAYKKYVKEFQSHLKSISPNVLVTKNNVNEVNREIERLVREELKIDA